MFFKAISRIRRRITPCSLQANSNMAVRRAEDGCEEGSRGDPVGAAAAAAKRRRSGAPEFPEPPRKPPGEEKLREYKQKFEDRLTTSDCKSG